MLFTIAPDSREFYIIFGITCLIVLVKVFIVLFLGKNLLAQKKEKAIAQGFLFAIFITVLGLLISRLLYMVFDFYYTKFDMALYPDSPGVWFWKIANFTTGIAQAYLVFIVDRNILQFKYKGMIAYAMCGGYTFCLLYPIHILDDFNLVSTVYVLPSLGILLLLFIFGRIARQSSGELRRVAWSVVLAVAFMGVAALFVNAALINALQPKVTFSVDVLMYIIQAAFKITGILLLGYSSTKFKFGQ